MYLTTKEERYCLDYTAKKHTENLKHIFPEKELRCQIPNFHIHASVSYLYIPTIDLPVLLEELCRPILKNIQIAHGHKNWDWGRAIPRKRNTEMGFSLQCREQERYISGRK
jgi:hypothetical protein